MIELNELKHKATVTAASPEWSASTMGRYTDGRWAIGRCVQLEAEAKADAEYIAAMSPTVTLALITRIYELETTLKESISHHRITRDVAKDAGLFCGNDEVNEETSWINSLARILAKGIP